MRKIPNSDNFYIDIHGKVFDSLGKERNYYLNGTNHVTCSIKINGEWQTFTIQKLLAVTYLTDDFNTKLVPNHIDGIKGNNELSNIELVTTQLNIIHGAILNGTEENKKIRVIDENGNTYLYSNFNDASTKLNLSIKDIWNSIKNNKPINGLAFFHQKFADKIPRELHKIKYLNIHNKVKLKILDLFTDKWNYFNSIMEAAKFFCCRSNSIHICISTENQIKLFRKQYLIFTDDCIVNEIDKNKILNSNHGGSDVVAYDIENNKVYIFINVKSFIKHSDLSKKSVYRILNSEKIERVGKWIFVYLKNKEKLDFFNCIKNLYYKCPDL